MPERIHETTEDGGLHTFRTEIPNTVIRGLRSRGLSIYAKWLYVYLKSVVGDNGEGFRSTTTIASEAGMSRGQVSAAKRELVKHGLITIKAGLNPRRNPDVIRISNIWVTNFEEFSVHVLNTESEAQSQEKQTDTTPSVHVMNTEDATSVHDMNTSIDAQEHIYQCVGSASVHHMNTGVHNMNTEALQCSPHELGVHNMNTEEDPLKKKKEDYSPPYSPPPLPQKTSEAGQAKPAKEKRAKRYMPKEETAQRALLASICDANFVRWHSAHYPHASIETQWTYFVNYCLANAKPYADFRAAFMNSFPWESSPAQRPGRAPVEATPPRPQANRPYLG